jgi:hypothetical protein
MINALPPSKDDMERLKALGLPANEFNQKAVRLMALHEEAANKNIPAQRLLLEIEGELIEKNEHDFKNSDFEITIKKSNENNT